MSQLCPCGSALEYSLCCQRYLSGDQVAPDPSHLMRSRYTAFVIKDADYLIKTWHPSCHAADFKQDIEAGFANTQWLGLTVYESCPGSHEDEGYVSFVARFTENAKPGAIIERSRFLRNAGNGIILTERVHSLVVTIPARVVQVKNLKSVAGSNA